MSYRVLARKYRPQTFEEIIGQAHVATTLTNAIKGQKVAHAYLFAGPRGVGKTTTARILAKALNCAKGPTVTPCNACESCQRITSGHELVDVMEIDAASNRGIEEIRELRENVMYAPAHSRYKVYIIDEAHQITHDAFNAFLKTLEEPPEHAIFILATTEHQKIPATILSRCQLFRFKRVSVDDIAGQLERILSQEKFKVEKEAVLRLARAAGGSVRDALSLMDQALAYASESLTAKQVEMLLGFLPDEFLIGFASAILERQPEGVLRWIRELVEEGWDLPQFVRDFREFLRLSIVEQIGAGGKPDALKLAARPITLAEMLHWIKALGQCLDEMRWNENPRLVLELYSLRLTQPFVDAGALLKRIEQLEKGGAVSAQASTPSAPRPAAAPTPSPRQVVGRGPEISKPTLDSPPVAAGNDAAKSVPPPAAPVTGDPAEQWKRLLSDLWKKPAVASQMERAFLKSASAQEWTVALPDKFALDSVQRSKVLVEETLAAITGQRVMVRLVQETRAAAQEENGEVVVDEREPAIVKDAGVQKVLQTFKGRIRPSEDNL